MRVVTHKKLRDCHQLKYLVAKSLFSTLCGTNQVEGVDQGSPFITSIDDNQLIIHERMGGSDHQTPLEIRTKCGTSGVMAISLIEHITSPNPTTTIEATILIVFVAFEAILPLSQLPLKFNMSQIQPFNQLGGGVTSIQLNLLSYVPSQVFGFSTSNNCTDPTHPPPHHP